MSAVKLLALLVGAFALLESTHASDVRPIVPSVDSTNDDQLVPELRVSSDGDQVVPRIRSPPLLGAQRDSVTGHKDAKALDLKDSEPKSKEEEDADEGPYPTPRARVDESKVEPKSGGTPTPRPRIEPTIVADEKAAKVVSDDSETPARSVRDSLEASMEDLADKEDDKIAQEPQIRYRFNAVDSSASGSDTWQPLEASSEEQEDKEKKGQPEEVLVVSDLSTSKEVETDADEDDETKAKIGDDEIQRYIDEIDREYIKKKGRNDAKEEVVDPKLGYHKYVVADDVGLSAEESSEAAASLRARREATDTNANKPQMTNERKSSGGLAYNLNFEPPKSPGSKPAELSAPQQQQHGKRAASMISDGEVKPTDAKSNASVRPDPYSREWFESASDSASESQESADATSDEEESIELMMPDPQLLAKEPAVDSHGQEHTFDEILHKVVKDRPQASANGDGKIYQQEVDRLPHPRPTIKNPGGILAVDPPTSNDDSATGLSGNGSESNEEEPEVDVLVLNQKTILIDDDDAGGQNRTNKILIEDSDVTFNVPPPKETAEKEAFSLRNGFTIGLHVSPLAMCLGTAILLLVILLRFALRYQKKRLIHAARMEDGFGNPNNNSSNKKHQHTAYDNESLKTVSTA